MKLTINQNLDINENEIIINCSYVDERIQKLINDIRQFSFSLEGELDGSTYQLPLDTIYYIESVDGRTFLYDRKNAYLCRQNLCFIDKQMENTSFVRISKSCILNCSYLKCVRPYANHRMEATLKNDEKLMISRNYINSLKEKLK